PTPKRERTIIPIVRSPKAIKIVNSIPIRAAIFGTNGEKRANASNGKVVNDPANVLLMPRSSRINVIKAPTDVNGARKLELINIIPTNSIQFVVCCLDVLSKYLTFLLKVILRHLSSLVVEFVKIFIHIVHR